MGRPRRVNLGGYVYHVLDRANGRLRIFRKNGDFEAFETILARGIDWSKRTAAKLNLESALKKVPDTFNSILANKTWINRIHKMFQ